MQSARLALAATLPLLLAGCFERTQPSVDNSVRPVQAMKVALSSEADSRVFAGVVRPRREADIGFRAGGRIVARLADVGTRVRVGQALAKLDPADLALSLRSAEADVASAEAAAAQATADAERSRVLRGQGWNSVATDDAKQAAARTAEQRVASARAALALARNRLDYAELRAPADGVITAVLADAGTVVSEGQPVLHLAETGAIEAEVPLPEAALPDAAHPGASLGLWARPDVKLTVRLREIAPAADGKLRTYAARYSIDSPPEWLALGMSVTLRLPGADDLAVATLPAAAVVDRGEGPMVWSVRDEGRLVPRTVHVRRLQQDRVVVAGLNEGELVVAVGGQKLDPAARVRVTDLRPVTE